MNQSTYRFFSAAISASLLFVSGFGCAHTGASRPQSTSGSASGSASGMSEVNPEERAERLFEILDVDGNGKITKEEARSGFKYLVASYDRGGRTEILAAKPGQESSATSSQKTSKRRPTNSDADKAFAALFDAPSVTTASISKEEFKKLVVRASDNADADPFAAFY